MKPSHPVRVLAVDDSSEGLFTLTSLLEHHGYEVITAQNGQEAVSRARKDAPDLILMDVNMPQMDGLEATEQLKSDTRLRFIPIVLLTSRDELDDIAQGLERGADDYIRKPYAQEELLSRLQAVLRTRKLYLNLQQAEHQQIQLRERLGEIDAFSGIIGKSDALQSVFEFVVQARDSDVPVLITGESGTGKELIASAVHYTSRRSNHPFVVQNCSAFQESLLESELFGHVKGAFTGAHRDKRGLFSVADTGTFFLDELGEMSPGLQSKLLRVLQDGSFTPVGATESVQVDTRVVAATHRNLREMIRQGTFREDLFYRLNVLHIDLPPLRERKEDIPLLLTHFLKDICIKAKKEPKQIADEALLLLTNYLWPGNVRELRNEVERMVVLSGDSELIPARVISNHIVGAARNQHDENGRSDRSPVRKSSQTVDFGVTLKEAISDLESRMISETLLRTQGNKSEAARILGISRSNLIAKAKIYGVE